MLLFTKRFHPGLVDGSITLTFRRWKTARVKPGSRYRCHPIGVLEVDAVDVVPLGTITEIEAKQAGFGSRAELVAFMSELGPVTDADELVRVKLHHAGDGDRSTLAMETTLTDDDVATLKNKLAKMDERSSEGPWVRATLKLIGQKPRVAASKLAAEVGRETAPFKADVVKLKKLGLTQSFEVGYEISPRGKAFLERVRWTKT